MVAGEIYLNVELGTDYRILITDYYFTVTHRISGRLALMRRFYLRAWV
jgi:hypothetical protein